MDVLPRITRQLFDQFREMSPLQRAISIAFVFVSLFGFGWLLILGNGQQYQPVSFGKVFGTDELVSAEQALASAGLTSFRRDGQRLMAPKKDLDRYNAALLEFDALPADLGTQMLKQFETLGPFSTDRQRQQMKEALLLQELRRMIMAVPDVEDARVAIASSERKNGWNQKPRSTANVTVKPRNGREISGTLINSLRHVVASMVPDLQPADVTIFDVTRGQAYTGESKHDPSDRRSIPSAGEIARQYEQQIQKALSFIPHVGVTVHIDPDDRKSTAVRHETAAHRHDPARVANRPAEIDDSDFPDEDWSSGDTHLTRFRVPNDDSTAVEQPSNVSPNAVQVSVSIPREYVREITARRNGKRQTSSDRIDPEAIEEEVVTKVERIVGRLIPTESSRDAVAVTCVDRVSSNSSTGARDPYQEVTALLNSPWGLPTLCVVLTLMGLCLLRPKSAVPSQPIADMPMRETENAVVIPPEPNIESTPDAVVTIDRVAMLRDEIRSFVESDPAATAEILSQWLSEATP